MKQISLLFDKTVHYWNSEQGEGVDKDGNENTFIWGIDVSHANGVTNIRKGDNIEDVLERYIKENLCLEIDASWLRIMDDGRVSLTVLENGEGEQVDNDREYKGQLYLCDYDISIQIQEVSTPSKEELPLILPKAERMT